MYNKATIGRAASEMEENKNITAIGNAVQIISN